MLYGRMCMEEFFEILLMCGNGYGIGAEKILRGFWEKAVTPKCLKLLQDGRAARQDWLTTTISRKLSAREQEKLQAALELLTRLVDD
jgi:hypothetical protein